MADNNYIKRLYAILVFLLVTCCVSGTLSTGFSHDPMGSDEFSLKVGSFSGVGNNIEVLTDHEVSHLFDFVPVNSSATCVFTENVQKILEFIDFESFLPYVGNFSSSHCINRKCGTVDLFYFEDRAFEVDWIVQLELIAEFMRMLLLFLCVGLCLFGIVKYHFEIRRSLFYQVGRFLRWFFSRPRVTSFLEAWALFMYYLIFRLVADSRMITLMTFMTNDPSQRFFWNLMQINGIPVFTLQLNIQNWLFWQAGGEIQVEEDEIEEMSDDESISSEYSRGVFEVLGGGPETQINNLFELDEPMTLAAEGFILPMRSAIWFFLTLDKEQLSLAVMAAMGYRICRIPRGRDAFVNQSNPVFSGLKPSWTYASVVKKEKPRIVPSIIPKSDTFTSLQNVRNYRRLSRIKKKLLKRLKNLRSEKEINRESFRNTMNDCLALVRDDMRCSHVPEGMIDQGAIDDFLAMLQPSVNLKSDLKEGVEKFAEAAENFSKRDFKVEHSVPFIENALSGMKSFVSDEKFLPIVLMVMVCGLLWYGFNYPDNRKICIIVSSMLTCYLVYKYGSSFPFVGACIAGFSFFGAKIVSNEDCYPTEETFTDQSFTWTGDCTEGLLGASVSAVYYLIYNKHASDSTILPFIKELGDMKKIEGGLKHSVEFFVRMLHSFSSWCEEHYDGFGFFKAESAIPAVDKLVTEVSELLDKFRAPGGADNSLLFSKENAVATLDIMKRIDMLYNKELPKDSSFAEARKVLFNLKQSLKDINSKFEALGRAQDSTRQVPEVVYLFGPSGTGKTFSTKIIFENVITRCLPECRLHNFLKNPGNEIFPFRPGGNFDGDGYFHQFAMLIDEFLGASDGVGVDTNFVVSFLQFVSDHPVLMQKADLSDKDCWFFLCKFMLLTGNRKEFKNVHALNHPMALSRRIKCYLTVPKKEYCTSATADSALPGARRLDMNKVPPLDDEGLPSLEIHDFILCDLMKADAHGSPFTVLDKPIDLPTLCDRIVDGIKTKEAEYERSIKMRVSLRKKALEQRYKERETPADKQIAFEDQMFSRFFSSKPEEFEIPDGLEERVKEKLSRMDLFERYFDAMGEDDLPGWEDLPEEIKGPMKKNFRAACFEDLYGTGEIKAESQYNLSKYFTLNKEKLNAWEKDLRERAGTASDACQQWIQKPAVKTILALSGVFIAFYGFWKFTRAATDIMVEQASGDVHLAKAKPKTVPKFSDVPASHGLVNQGALFKDNVDNLAAKLWRKSIYCLVNVMDIPLGFVIGLKGRTCLMPKHYAKELRSLLETRPTFQINLVNDSTELKPFFYLKDCTIVDIEDRDISLMTIPKCRDEFSDITGCFVSEKAKVLSEVGFRAGAVKPLIDVNTLQKLGGFELVREKVFRIGPQVCPTASYSSKGYVFKANTNQGMCGIPAIIADDTAPNVQIFGMLVAGDARTMNSYFVSVTSEDVLEWTKKTVSYVKLELPGEETVDQCAPLPQFRAVGVCDKPPNEFAKTDIKRSPLYGRWGPSLYGPSVLHDRVVLQPDGTSVLKRPKMMALNKYNRNDKAVSEPLVFALADTYYSSMVNNSTAPDSRRCYEYQEAVKGVVGTACDPISKTTSCGWDWTFDGHSKADIFGTDGFDFDRPLAKELENRVMEMIRKFENREMCLVAFLDKLKSEKRLHEKNKECKTRLFTFPPLEFLIVCRMYLMAFNVWAIDNAVLNGLTIGVNPFGIQWTILAKKMKRFGDRIISGDFSGWDGGIQVVWFFALFHIIKRFYASVYSEKDNNVLDMICETMTNSVHIFCGEEGAVFYQWLGCMCSGIFLTGLGNSIINQLVIRYAICDVLLNDSGGSAMWPKVALDFEFLEDNIDVVTNGDDNLISVSELLVGVTQETLTWAFAKIGFTYTDETKTGLMQDFRRLEDVFYLKRTFVWSDDFQRWLSPHMKDPVMQACYWMRKSGTMKDLKQTVRMCFLELSQWGRETYEQTVADMIPEVEEALEWLPAELTWDQAIGAAIHLRTWRL